MSKLKTALFWLVIGILICLPIAVAEYYLRSVGLGNPILFYTNASYRFAPQANQKQSRLRGASVTLDSKGLRSTKEWTAAADAKILFIGDSVTWAGTYIDDEDTFSEGVCQRLEKATGKSFTCGNAGANQYGSDNMAERIRYKDIKDESVVVVTLIAADTVRGLADSDGRFFFTSPPPWPLPALWEATTFVIWRAYQYLRPTNLSYRGEHDLRVAERSLENLFSAIRETERPERKVLIVLSPVKDELHGREGGLTKHVQSLLVRSGKDVLDLHASVSEGLTGDFYYDPLHLDVSGHRFYADRIARRLVPFFTNNAPVGNDDGAVKK